MSFFYLLAAIALWVWLTNQLWRFWRRLWKKSETKVRCIITPVFTIIAIVWLSTFFWYGGGRKFYYDAEVRRLCAIDGGVKVYETVTLPPERFDKYGNVHIPSKKSAKPEDEYYSESDSYYYKKGDPEIFKSYYRIIRRNDEKIMSESTNVIRRGGDMPGPWHPSSFSCPDDPNLFRLTFKIQEKKP